MPRHGAKKAIPPWLSEKADCKDGRFIQAGNSFFLSKEVQKLSTGARWLYFCMAIESGGRRDFIFPQKAATKYGIKSATLRRKIDELEEKGFIEADRLKNLRKPNEYCFSFNWKLPPQGK